MRHLENQGSLAKKETGRGTENLPLRREETPHLKTSQSQAKLKGCSWTSEARGLGLWLGGGGVGDCGGFLGGVGGVNLGFWGKVGG